LVVGNNYKGVVFPKGYEVPIAFGAEQLQKRFTPNENQIKIAEEGFANQYNKLLHVNVSNVLKFFKSYKRQYLGYINYKGDSIVLMQLIDFGSCFAFKRRSAFGRWKEQFISCLSEFCYKYLKFYHYDLNTGRLEMQ